LQTRRFLRLLLFLLLLLVVVVAIFVSQAPTALEMQTTAAPIPTNRLCNVSTGL
jgi:hypothetical protein